MLRATHALTSNNRLTEELWSSYETPEEILRNRLARLDANKVFAIVLWRMPPGLDFDSVKAARDCNEYIQGAGSADRLVVEIRSKTNGGYHQWAIGRGGDSATREFVEVSGDRMLVPGSEVLTCQDALELFMEYLKTDSVPSKYSRREITLK